MSPGPKAAAIRYGAAALVLGTWAALWAWIIRGEGEAYRGQLRAERLGSESGPESEPEPVGPTVAPRPGRPADPPRPKSAPRQPRKGATRKGAAPRPKVAPRPAEGGPRPDRAEPAAPKPAQAPKLTPSPAAAPAPESPPDPFWDLPEQKKAWDLARLTVEDEAQLGQALHQMVLKTHTRLASGPLPRRLAKAAEPFLKAVERKGVRYTFTVLDCQADNAFSHPGGYIYACRGLLERIPEDDDFALEFLVGHEVAHVDLAHAIYCLNDPEVKKLGLGTVPLFHSLMIPWGYKDEQDLAADGWAWRKMSQAGRSKRESLAFLRRLVDVAQDQPFGNYRRKPGEDPEVAPIDNHLRAHPIPSARLEALTGLMAPPAKP